MEEAGSEEEEVEEESLGLARKAQSSHQACATTGQAEEGGAKSGCESQGCRCEGQSCS